MSAAIRYEQAGPKPADVDGCVWVSEDNPHAGNCEAQWQWALYPIGRPEQHAPILPQGYLDRHKDIRCEP